MGKNYKQEGEQEKAHPGALRALLTEVRLGRPPSDFCLVITLLLTLRLLEESPKASLL